MSLYFLYILLNRLKVIYLVDKGTANDKKKKPDRFRLNGQW